MFIKNLEEKYPHQMGVLYGTINGLVVVITGCLAKYTLEVPFFYRYSIIEII